MSSAFLRAFLIFSALTALARANPLDPTFAAHGGLDTWQSKGSLSYDLNFEIGGNTIRDHHHFDLKSRTGIVSNADYAIGSDGQSVWFDSSTEGALPVPPKFYFNTPFYFLGIPFVFADPGVQSESLPDATFEGKNYRVVKVTFAAGTGDAPDDSYIAYVNPETSRVHLIIYTVTYFARAAGKPTDGILPNVMIYDQWESVSGLTFPTHARVYQWRNNTRTEDLYAEMSFKNIRVLNKRPDPESFARPAGAIDAP